MKKLLLSTAFLALTATAAQAQIDVQIGGGRPVEPVYVAHPAYYHSYGHDSHHRGDWDREHPELHGDDHRR